MTVLFDWQNQALAKLHSTPEWQEKHKKELEERKKQRKLEKLKEKMRFQRTLN